MDRRMASTGLLLAAASLGLAPMRGWAKDGQDDDHDDGEARLSVTVSFGAGLNTAQPGNSANHHVLPGLIKVRKGGCRQLRRWRFPPHDRLFPGCHDR